MIGIILIFCIYFEHSLSATNTIKRICISGAGIAGLSLACSLLRAKPDGLKEIALIDSRNSINQSSLGGGLQLSSGVSVLEELGLTSEFERVALPMTSITCFNRNQQILFSLDTSLMHSPLHLPRSALSYSIMRDALHSLLFRLLTSDMMNTDIKIRILSNTRLVSFQDHSSGYVTIKVQDRTGCAKELSDFDLVIAADGAKSLVREQLSPDRNQLSLNSRSPSIRIAYLVMGASERRSNAEFEQFMGDGVYSLCSRYGGERGAHQMLAVVYRDHSRLGSKDAEKGEWAESECKTRTLETIVRQLDRGGLSSLRPLQTFMHSDNLDEARAFDLVVEETDWWSSLGSPWSSAGGRVHLIGDAAHPTPPFLGQGANQALLDARQVSRNIAEYNRAICSGNVVSPRIIGLSWRRRLLTWQLSRKARLLGNIETLGGVPGLWAKDAFFRTMSVLGVIQREFVNKALYTE